MPSALHYGVARRMLLKGARPRSIPALVNRQPTFHTDGDLVSPLVMYSVPRFMATEGL